MAKALLVTDGTPLKFGGEYMYAWRFKRTEKLWRFGGDPIHNYSKQMGILQHNGVLRVKESVKAKMLAHFLRAENAPTAKRRTSTNKVFIVDVYGTN